MHLSFSHMLNDTNILVTFTFESTSKHATSPYIPSPIRMVGAERLKGNLSTVGIVVSDWTYYKRVRESQTNLRSITFMTWDFGGQEEYYATHQCFISRRSLYLVVWNVTHGMTGAEELRPWLLNIQVSLFPPLPPLTLSLFLLFLSLFSFHFSPLSLAFSSSSPPPYLYLPLFISFQSSSHYPTHASAQGVK